MAKIGFTGTRLGMSEEQFKEYLSQVIDEIVDSVPDNSLIPNILLDPIDINSEKLCKQFGYRAKTDEVIEWKEQIKK